MKHPREMTLAELEALPVALRLRALDFRFLDTDGRHWSVGAMVEPRRDGRRTLAWYKTPGPGGFGATLHVPKIVGA